MWQQQIEMIFFRAVERTNDWFERAAKIFRRGTERMRRSCNAYIFTSGRQRFTPEMQGTIKPICMNDEHWENLVRNRCE